MLIKAIVLILLLEAVTVQVNGVPLNVLGPSHGTNENIALVKDLTAEAHNRILKMEKVHADAQRGDRHAMKKIKGAFGIAPDMKAIGEHIQTFKHGKFKMNVDIYELDGHALGAYDPNSDHVKLSEKFYKANRNDQVLAILHEGAHAVLKAKDIFNAKGKPTNQQKATNPGDKTGYRDSDLTEMRNSLIFSPQTHHNADSWSVFGDLCRRALERRAYEETDLVKRDEILESRAAACAMRSSAKSSKSAKTSSGSKGGDKKTSPRSHSVPKPLAHGGALRSIPRGSVKKPAAKRPVAHGAAKESAPARAGTKKLSPVGGVKKPSAAGGAKKPTGRPTAIPVPRKKRMCYQC